MDNINYGRTTELFLVNMIHTGGVPNYVGYGIEEGDWICFRTTHSLAKASDMAKELRSGGHEVRVVSVLLDHEGRVKHETV